MSTHDPAQPADEFRRLTPQPGGSSANPQAAAWVRAVAQGFHAPEPVAETVDRELDSMADSGVVLKGVYPGGDPAPGALDPQRPVATFASWDSELTVGAQRGITVRLISDITVRPTHTRRGLLRRLMTGDLAEAHEAGVPVAALTATEATIYGRFGFGAATSTARITVDPGKGPVSADEAARDGGRVELADPQALEDLAPEVFLRAHRETPGSVLRPRHWWSRISGRWDRHEEKPDRRVRAAVYHGPDGAVDGYVSYVFEATSGMHGRLEVRDLVAATPGAHRALWEFLCTVELVTQITYDRVPVEDPLLWFMRDRGGYTSTETDHCLWLRILDPVAALSARELGPGVHLVLRIRDRQEFAAGDFRVDTTGDTPVIERLEPGQDPPAAPDVTLDVSDLGALYLGGVRVATLHRAGKVEAVSSHALVDLERLLATPEVPFCASPF